jgi:hypothetical protein
VAKLAGCFVSLEASAHDAAQRTMRGHAMPGRETEVLVDPDPAGIRLCILRLRCDPGNR